MISNPSSWENVLSPATEKANVGRMGPAAFTLRLLCLLTVCTISSQCSQRRRDVDGGELPADRNMIGFDMQGLDRSCWEKKNDASQCGEPPADKDPEQFRTDCEAKGYEILRCGCGMYLCSQNVWNPIKK